MSLPDEQPNPLHAIAPPGSSWSSINLAEAVPGVMTPLCASAWVPASELGLRLPFHAMGVLPGRELAIPDDPDERITNAFYGRMAVRVDFLCRIGDLVPGQSGEALSRDFFGFVPPDYESSPSLRRLPMILLRYPRTFVTIAKRVERLRASTDAWWRTEIPRTDTLDLGAAQARLVEAKDRFAEALAAQALISASAIQPVQEQLDKVCRAASVDPAVLLRGASHEEGVVLDDLWQVSRGTLTLEEFLGRHGYHGPGEGEAATTVWREDPAPLRRLVAQYATKPDAEAPGATAAQHAVQRTDAERRLLEASGRLGRVRTRLVLRLARRLIPLRGTGKVSYLQALDVLRATTRRIGALIVADGLVDLVDDAFYLTADELADPGVLARGGELRAVVAERRALRARYQSLRVPAAWTGQPAPEVSGSDDTGGDDVTTLRGVGACAGTVEGRAVIALDPSSTEIDEGDILVAHTTDPAWVSLMFLAGALVVDIGGLMSHAAVVARELGIPCVMNTGHGTTALRTGDRITVDGTTGTVTVLGRAEDEETSGTTSPTTGARA
ncbi:MAG TPA: PEP-utilizing enzyme [Nocardioides sp.]|nr:PEP-utilizing enzyme [Nocardioides sp.]